MVQADDTGQGVPALGGKPPAMDLSCPFNPFLNDSFPFSGLEIVKAIILLPLAVVRAALWLVCLGLGYLCTKIALIGVKDVLTKPLPAWRRPLLYPVRFLARVILFACGFHWISVKGRPAPRERAPIIVSNHVTFVDPVFIFFRHFPVIVTAQENLSMPIAGSIMKAMQVISVNRVSTQSRRNASGEIKRRAMCNDWHHVMIFPEATTTNGKALVTFKAGAFTPGYAVQPIVVRYPHISLDPCWVAQGPPIYSLLFRLMTQFHNSMMVEYLPIIEPSLKEQKNARLFAERVRLTMAAALNVSVTDHGYEDAALAMEAKKRKAESVTALLEFTKFERMFHLANKDTKRLFSKFYSLGMSETGLVPYHNFLQSLDLPDCPPVSELFHLFDSPGNGYFNFKQYTLGMAFVLKHAKFREASEATFKHFGGEDDGLQLDVFGSCLRGIIPLISDRQILLLFERIDHSKSGVITEAAFLEFLEGNPEYLALFMISKPELLSNEIKLGQDEPPKLNGVD